MAGKLIDLGPESVVAEPSDLENKANKNEMAITPVEGADTDKTTIQLQSGMSVAVLTKHQDISGKANTSEMSITPGEGATADRTTIQLHDNLATTVLTEHQDISGKSDKSELDYSFVQLTAVNNIVVLQDHATNNVQTVTDPLTLMIPVFNSDRARNLRVRLSVNTINGSTLPIIIFGLPAGETGAVFETAGASFPMPDSEGTWLYSFMEETPHKISVYLEKLTEVTNVLTTDNYVQDGLMEFWDGINNAGTGMHDPNATMWKSLVSGGQDLTIDRGVWTNGNCLYNPVDSTRAAYDSNSKKVAYVTGEFVICNDNPYKSDGTGGNTDQFVFMAGTVDYARRYLVLSKFEIKYYDLLAAAGGTVESERITTSSAQKTGFHSYSFAIHGSAYMDGVQQEVSRPVSGWGAGSGLYLGSNGINATNRIFNGRYFSIRLYNRYLTPAEVTHNYTLDRMRFNPT